jgi:small subunit ribosomal protein S3Ae
LTAPTPFSAGGFGFTCINKSAGTGIWCFKYLIVVATEAIKGRVVEASLADLQGNSD